MKLLSIVVPCYNSAAYMKKCINTLLVGGEEVEILIVDDGSTDDTARIADAFAQAHPRIVQVIHKPNGGHGDAVMTGLRNAVGYYFKVVDSDDWVDAQAYRLILDTLRGFVEAGEAVDLLVSNYVYDKVGIKRKRVVRYASALPQGKVFGWDDIDRMRKGQYILMHAIIYRTGLLHECELELPTHTFYVDNLYAYIPMRSVQYLYYLNADFYHYFIGREDQSVQEATMIRRIDQQLRVNRMMVEAFDLETVQNQKQRSYLFHYLEIITTVSSVLMLKAGKAEHLEKMHGLWGFIREYDIVLYNKLSSGILGRTIHLPGWIGRSICIMIYKLMQKLFCFN